MKNRRVSQKAPASAMQGCIAIFDGHKPLKMEESENRTFPIPSRKSPRMDFCDSLNRGAGIPAPPLLPSYQLQKLCQRPGIENILRPQPPPPGLGHAIIHQFQPHRAVGIGGNRQLQSNFPGHEASFVI